MTEAAPNFDPMNPEHAAQLFEQSIAQEAARAKELDGSFSRAPATIENEAQIKGCTTLVKALKECAKAIDNQRKQAKGKYDACGKAVQGTAMEHIDRLKRQANDIENRMTVFLRKKADEERRKREEDARKAAEEAERAAKEAANKAAALQSEEDLDVALAAEEAAKRQQEAADRAQRDAEAKAAELARSRGEYGGVGSLKTALTFEIKNAFDIPPSELWRYLDADAIQKAVRKFLSLNRENVKRMVDAGEGDKIIKGVRFFEDVKTVVR